MGEVRTELAHDGAVLRVVFEGKGNVLTAALMARMDAALAQHETDQDLKLVTIASSGKHFSFGASVQEHRRDQAAHMLARFHALIRRIGAYPVPTMALVQGQCLGGAFELVLACNFVVAAPEAVFACPEIKLGVFPPALAALGPARLGQSLTERLLLTGDELSATHAREVGLVLEVADSAEALPALADALFARWFAASSAFTLRHGLAAAREASDWHQRLDADLVAAERRYVDHIVTSHDGNEGIEAFLAKRPPAWRNA